MATTSDLRRGMLIRHNGDVWRVVEFQHIAPGNWRAMTRLKLKNLNNGKVIEDRMRAGDDIDVVQSETRTIQYLYKDGDTYNFMDTENYEQIALDGRVAAESPDRRGGRVVFLEFLRPEESAGRCVEADEVALGAERIDAAIGHRRRAPRPEA